LSASDRRVWIIAGPSDEESAVERAATPMGTVLEREFTRHHAASHFVVFVNDASAAESLSVRAAHRLP
jgi:hypothetical protein